MIQKQETYVFALRHHLPGCRVQRGGLSMGVRFGLILLLFVTAIVSGEPASTSVHSLPVPADASDVKRLVLEPDGASQLSFRLRAEYPSDDVIDFYDKHFAGRAWDRCEGPSRGWTSFIEGGESGAARVHRMMAYWASESEGMIAFAVVEYRSPWSGRFGRPENDLQYTTLVLMWGIDNMKGALGELDVTCPRTPQQPKVGVVPERE